MAKSLELVSRNYELLSQQLDEVPENARDPGFMRRYNRAERAFKHAKKYTHFDRSQDESSSHHIFAKVKRLFGNTTLEPVSAEF